MDLSVPIHLTIAIVGFGLGIPGLFWSKRLIAREEQRKAESGK